MHNKYFIIKKIICHGFVKCVKETDELNSAISSCLIVIPYKLKLVVILIIILSDADFIMLLCILTDECAEVSIFAQFPFYFTKCTFLQ